jgi:hypothetical protein
MDMQVALCSYFVQQILYREEIQYTVPESLDRKYDFQPTGH